VPLSPPPQQLQPPKEKKNKEQCTTTYMIHWFCADICSYKTVLSSSASISQMKNYNNISIRSGYSSIISGFAS
jgi:hypothetical protein